MQESIHYSPMEAITLRIQDKLIQSTGITIPWYALSSAVYDTMHEFSRELSIGDTFAFPNGTTARIEFKPSNKNIA